MPRSATVAPSSSGGGDVEKQDIGVRTLESEHDDDDEPLEKVKEKPPPGINASLVLLYAVFFSMITIGLVNLNSCPVNRLIPVYLIVAGFVGALAKFLSKMDSKFAFRVAMVLVLFDIAWNGYGTYIIYKEYQPNYDSSQGEYCNRTTYLLAFWLLTFQYTILGLFVLLSACYLLMQGDFKKR